MSKLETRLAQGGSRWDQTTGAVSMPVYHANTFRHPALGESTGFDYSRSANPTRQVLEQLLASLENASRALAFSSGMAAVDCLLRIFLPGQRILVLEDIYGGTFRLLETISKPFGVIVDFVQYEDFISSGDLFEGKKYHGVLLESPTNPTLKVSNLRKIAAQAKAKNALTIVDNTFMTPILQKPLDLGADIVLYSASKFLSGHNDVIGGVLVIKESELAEKLAIIQNTTGAILGPQDCWLLIRGLKTLSVRMERQQQNAIALVSWLENHPAIEKVLFPGHNSPEQAKLLAEQTQGPGAMVSFVLKKDKSPDKLLRAVNLWIFAESLGGTESLITLPSKQTHGDVPEETRLRLGISDSLFRLSVGLEHIDDLIADLDQALAKA